jgi:AraC-like DNA-binding protein
VGTTPDLDQRRSQRPSRFAYQDLLVGPVSAIPSLLAEHGLNPTLVLAEVGLAPGLFDHPENRVSYEALARLLATCVERTQCRHFGLLVGQRFRMESMGVLGGLMCNSPTLRDALRMATTHLELQDRGSISIALDMGNSRSALGYSVFAGNVPAADQILDGAIAIHHQMLRRLCGRSWKAASVQFSHSRPARISPFRKFFGANVAFDARVSAVVFDSRWLDQPVVGADPASYAAILKAVESIQSAQPTPFLEQVRRAIYSMAFNASVSAADLARLFGLNERMLQRRLKQEGVTARELVGEVRSELSQHLLRDTDLPIAGISSLLGYSDATVFARAFRVWSGLSPTEWRQMNASVKRP